MISHELSTKIALERVGGGSCPSHFSVSHYASLQQRNINAQRIHLRSPERNTSRKTFKGEGESPVQKNKNNVARNTITTLAVKTMAGYLKLQILDKN